MARWCPPHPGADRRGTVGGGPDASHAPYATRAPALRSTQSDRRAGLRPDQAGPWLSAILAVWAAAGAGGMDPDLHRAQYAEALADASATPPPSGRWAAGSEQEPEESAASVGRAGDRYVKRSGSERDLIHTSGRWCSHCNVEQAPRQDRWHQTSD